MKSLRSHIMSLLVLLTSLAALQAQPVPADTPGTLPAEGVPLVVINLDAAPRSLRLGAEPGLLTVSDLAPAAASPLSLIQASGPLRLFQPDSSGSWAVLRDGLGRFVEYRLAQGRLHALLLLPGQAVRIVQLNDSRAGGNEPRLLFANSQSQAVAAFQLASAFNSNILVYCESVPPLEVTNVAWISWPARYGVFFEDSLAEGGFRGLSPVPAALPEFVAGSWWVATATADGVVLSRIR